MRPALAEQEGIDGDPYATFSSRILSEFNEQETDAGQLIERQTSFARLPFQGDIFYATLESMEAVDIQTDTTPSVIVESPGIATPPAAIPEVPPVPEVFEKSFNEDRLNPQYEFIANDPIEEETVLLGVVEDEKGKKTSVLGRMVGRTYKELPDGKREVKTYFRWDGNPQYKALQARGYQIAEKDGDTGPEGELTKIMEYSETVQLRFSGHYRNKDESMVRLAKDYENADKTNLLQAQADLKAYDRMVDTQIGRFGGNDTIPHDNSLEISDKAA